MKLTQSGINLIKNFESCKLACYLDIRGLNTIGYGHRTTLPVGASISQAEANALLEQDLTKFSQGVTQMLHIELNDNQFSALVSLAYNIGLNALGGSSIIKTINAGGIRPAADLLLAWDYSGGLEVPGLLRRREAERSLYLS